MRRFNVIEAFSGIGSQAKAMKKAGLNHWKVVNTIEWDINAIIAYFFIHHKETDYQAYKSLSDEELDSIIDRYDLSMNGKVLMSVRQRKTLPHEIRWRLAAAIDNTHNLGSIANLSEEEIDDEIDLLTYSFPCQDLSIAGVWHGLNTGISRDVENRSGMLWEVERILIDKYNSKKRLPTFLLMENVVNILSKRHNSDFQMWQRNLERIGYRNRVYRLNATDFGIPQNRERVFMVSVYVGNNANLLKSVDSILNTTSFKNDLFGLYRRNEQKDISKFLRVDYSIEKYKKEADESQPNDTPSRQKIWDDNLKIFDDEYNFTTKPIPTITTKQDRNPNSGVIYYPNHNNKDKASFRYLTPRECFLFMGFDESDYDALIDNNFTVSKRGMFFTQAKLIKMAGNSIVVDVLVEIFKLIEEINMTVSNRLDTIEKCI